MPLSDIEDVHTAYRTLPETIASRARVFCTAVYSLGNCDRRALQVHEKAFWARHERLCAAVGGAKRDRDDSCQKKLFVSEEFDFNDFSP